MPGWSPGSSPWFPEADTSRFARGSASRVSAPSEVGALEAGIDPAGEMALGAVVGQDRRTDFLLATLTARPIGHFPNRPDGRYHDADQHADDRDHHQQLDQRETAAGAGEKTVRLNIRPACSVNARVSLPSPLLFQKSRANASRVRGNFRGGRNPGGNPGPFSARAR